MPTDDTSAQPAPDTLADSGRRLWESVAGPFALDEHELALLLAAARTADHLDRLAADIAAAESLVIEGRKSDNVAHPALVEHRQQSLTLSRLLAALRIPSGDESDGRRPQRRGGSRQPYSVTPSRRSELRAVRGQA